MKPKMVIIGGSAGSLQIVLEILSNLKTPLQYSIVLVFHRKNNSSEETLINLLNSKSLNPVKEAEDKEVIKKSHIYVAPAGYHLLIEANHSFSLDVSEKINFSRPSIDVTILTASDVYKENMVAILLSGANKDGIDGLLKVKASGGYCIAQDPSSAQVNYMPSQAISYGAVDLIASPVEISSYLNQYGSKFK